MPLVISGKELSTMVMSSIYDNKENIRSDTTHLDYDGFVEALARMVIKKSEIFTKIFENFRDNRTQSAQEVVEGVDQGLLEKVFFEVLNLYRDNKSMPMKGKEVVTGQMMRLRRLMIQSITRIFLTRRSQHLKGSSNI